MSWQVHEVIHMTDKVAVVFFSPEHALKVRMLWNGAWRAYEWDGTGLKVEPKYQPAINRALRKHFRTNYY